MPLIFWLLTHAICGLAAAIAACVLVSFVPERRTEEK